MTLLGLTQTPTVCIWAHADRLLAGLEEAGHLTCLHSAVRRQNSSKGDNRYPATENWAQEEYFSEERRVQTGTATRATTLSVPQRQALCSSWEELLSQEGLHVSSEGAARSESLADCRQVALQGVQPVFPYLQRVLTTPAGLPSR